MAVSCSAAHTFSLFSVLVVSFVSKFPATELTIVQGLSANNICCNSSLLHAGNLQNRLEYSTGHELLIAPGILPYTLSHYSCLLWSRPTFGRPFCPRTTRSLHSSIIALLLLLGGDVSTNPGPSPSCRPPPQVSFGCFNARSAVSKTALLHDLISERDLDLLVLTETWVTSATPRSESADLAPPGYFVLNVPRAIVPDGPAQGGGLAVVFRESITVRPVALPNVHVTSFELQVVKVVAPPSSHVIIAVYRPPHNSLATFFDELTDVIAAASIESNDNIIVCGDLS